MSNARTQDESESAAAIAAIPVGPRIVEPEAEATTRARPAPRRFSADERSCLYSAISFAIPVCTASIGIGAIAATPAARSPGALGALGALTGSGLIVARALRRRAGAVRRRVLLADGATPDDAGRATGAPVEPLGAIDLDDPASFVELVEAGVDDVVIGRPLDEAALRERSWRIRDAQVRLYAPRPDGARGFHRYRRAAISPGGALVKRALDVVGAAVALALVAPVLLVAAALIKLGSPGPVFFGQLRLGPRGPFRALKLRTMHVGADRQHARLIEEHGNMFKLRRDPRVTRVGRWLRRFSIDELPQLAHVLSGRMSLVGPRPPLPMEVARYTPAELRRLGVTPGCTGLWQVSGRSDLPFEKWVELDAHYIEHWSPSLERSILARTAGAVLGGRGAY